MMFDPRRVGDHRPVMIHNQTIIQVPSYKYLDVFFDNSLTWNIHVDNPCSSLRIYGVDQKFKIIFYQAVFESLIWYCMSGLESVC